MKREDVTDEELQLLEETRAAFPGAHYPDEPSPAEYGRRILRAALSLKGCHAVLGLEYMQRQDARVDQAKPLTAQRIADALRNDLEESAFLWSTAVLDWISQRRRSLLEFPIKPESGVYFEEIWTDLETIAAGLVARPALSPKGGRPPLPPGIVKEESYWAAHERRLTGILTDAVDRLERSCSEADNVEEIRADLDDLDFWRPYRDQADHEEALEGGYYEDSFSSLFWTLERSIGAEIRPLEKRFWGLIVSDLVFALRADGRTTAQSLARETLREIREHGAE